MNTAGWPTETIEACLERISVPSVQKLGTKDYQVKGEYPIVDQGQELIAGWTDDEQGVISILLPLVVFGDHTRTFKYIDFPFVRGADGTQLLKPRAGINPLFFYYACRSLDLPSRGYNRHFSLLKEQSISIPDLGEQVNISQSLHQIEGAILIQNDQLRTTQELKQLAMRNLFRCGLRDKPQKETEIGLVPESWNCEKLGDIAEIAYGAQAAVASVTDPSMGTLILTNVNISIDGDIDMGKKRYYRVPEHQRDRLILLRGDVLFNWRSGSSEHVGKTACFDLDGEVTYSSFILRFRPHHAISSSFLHRYLTYLRLERFFSTQSNISSINSVYNASLSATIPIWFPDPGEQQEIVTILDGIDRKIDLHKRKKAALEELFKVLLHKLMTGEIRVSELNLSAVETLMAEKVPA